MVMSPATRMTIDSTAAKIGRSTKNFAKFIAIYSVFPALKVPKLSYGCREADRPWRSSAR